LHCRNQKRICNKMLLKLRIIIIKLVDKYSKHKQIKYTIIQCVPKKVAPINMSKFLRKLKTVFNYHLTA